MKKKTHITLIVILITSIQVWAQCRLVGRTYPDSSSRSYFSYDKSGKIIACKHVFGFGKNITKTEFQYTYNSNDKVASVEYFMNDKLTNIWNLIYENGLITKRYIINTSDSKVSIDTLIYNENKQLISFTTKKDDAVAGNGSFEYASEGWLSRMTVLSKDNSYMLEFIWDKNEKIQDEPEYIFFPGYPLSMFSDEIRPTEPSSVKGVGIGSIYYKIEKGNQIKIWESQVYDIRANAEGLWLENKFKYHDFTTGKDYMNMDKAIYEGCKN